MDQRKPAGDPGLGSGCPGDPDPILRAVFDLATLVRDQAQEIARGLALSPPVAMALAQINGTISMGELGQRLGCERSFITAIADELEQNALVRREPDRTDRRVKHLVLTPKGAALRARLDSEFYARLPWQRLGEEQRATLLGLLATLLQDGRDTGQQAGRDASPR